MAERYPVNKQDNLENNNVKDVTIISQAEDVLKPMASNPRRLFCTIFK